MHKRFSVGVLVLVAAALLAACGGGTPVESPLATPPVDTPNPTPAQAAIRPAGAETCSQMADLLEQTYNMPVTTAEAPFEDFVRGQTGTGCQTTVTGTGVDFPEGVDSMAMVTAMEGAGWTMDQGYAAGGAQDNLMGFTKGDELCLYLAHWEPAPEVDCPQDQPIGACEMTPKQRLWTVTLNCATVSD